MAGTAPRRRNVQSISSLTDNKNTIVGEEEEKQQQQRQQDTQKADDDDNTTMRNFLHRQPPWIILAIGSGTCAAINGVFAKLTTTSSTSSLSSSLSAFLGLSSSSGGTYYVNLAVRALFFGLNLVFNGVMWALFTAALAKGDSTTRVSIVNVSANFFVTALLGWLIFSEKLPWLWWLGAALLAAGNVIIGGRRQDENDKKKSGAEGQQQESEQARRRLVSSNDDEQEEEDLFELEVNAHGEREREGKKLQQQNEEARRVKTAEDIDAPI